MPGERLPDELVAAVLRVDELVQHFEHHPDVAVRDQVVELLQRVDGLHRAGLRRVARLLRAAGLERRALDDAEVRLLYMLYDLGEDAPLGAPSAAPPPRGNFIPLASLVREPDRHG
jgi:hypothetical protein